jgi:hypothetical protein
MPTVPRNSQTETRIDSIPGVQSVQPHGAEDMSAQIGALGRQAGTIDEKIQAIGAQGRAIQNVFGATADAAVSLDRVQRLRDLRDVDATENEVFNSLKTKMDGQDDPQTGTRIPGTLEAKYDPEGKDGEKSSAVISTSKAYAEIISDKNGSFSKLSPRAQELFKQRFTPQYRAFEAKAQEQDDNNRQIRVKAIDMAASKRNADLLDQNITNEPAWLGNLPLATQSEAMRQFRYGMVDPTVSNEADIQWRDKSIQPLYEQAKKDIASKYAYGRSLGLLQMADAVPIGSPDGDAKAGQLIDTAVNFASTWPQKDATALTPEQIAKTQEMAQAARERRMQRSNALEARNVAEAESTASDIVKGFEPNPSKLTEKLFKLPAPQQARLIRFMQDNKAADEMTLVQDGYQADSISPAPKEERVDALMSIYGRLTTTKAKAYFAKLKTDQLSEERKQDEPRREAKRGMINTMLNYGVSVENGVTKSVKEYDLIEMARQSVEAGDITPHDRDVFLKGLASNKNENRTELAQAAMTAFGKIVGNPDAGTMFSFKKDTGFDLYDGTGEKKKNATKPDDMVSTVPLWTNSRDGQKVPLKDDDGDIVTMKLTAQLGREVLNAAMAYEMQAKTRGVDKVAPMDLNAYLIEMFTFDKSDTVRALREQEIKKRAEQTYIYVDQMKTHIADQMLRAEDQGASDRINANANN